MPRLVEVRARSPSKNHRVRVLGGRDAKAELPGRCLRSDPHLSRRLPPKRGAAVFPGQVSHQRVGPFGQVPSASVARQQRGSQVISGTALAGKGANDERVSQNWKLFVPRKRTEQGQVLVQALGLFHAVDLVGFVVCHDLFFVCTCFLLLVGHFVYFEPVCGSSAQGLFAYDGKSYIPNTLQRDEAFSMRLVETGFATRLIARLIGTHDGFLLNKLM